MLYGASQADMRKGTELPVTGRDEALTALIRCKAYGLYSHLLASPHEVDRDEQLRRDAVINQIQPYGIDLRELLRGFLEVPLATRKLEYSELFEIGDSGPMVAIREQHWFADTAGIREELIRFYDFFAYPLVERYAWVPDHLSIMLEFCQVLCYREFADSSERLSFQLAQLDFVARHLVSWLPRLADRVEASRPASIYTYVARSLQLFVVRDYEWQTGTVPAAGGSSDHG